ncbi:hypothetical protein [Streptomyces sp. NBC_01373]|uniref:hypothetical protein n=1 Tax=Streptomyces sp. NBC_01373 TaxID=2903843 RepID=UPI002257B31E|nr:hypothetical protein [Streptomyces sp. NBC_01373]MCX4707068.1 hypothetical protein [Streptomyces sp. NBC_01373]
MTASPPLNGHPRPTMPVLGDWRPAPPETVEEQSNPQPEPAETSELVAQAQAEAIRAQAWADAEAKRIAAEAAAKAELVKAEEEARKLRLANDRAERKAREEQEASEARIAESRKRKADADRARQDADRQDAKQRQTDAEQAKAVEKSSKRWRNVALAFYALCAGVALPVQMNAFYDPKAKYLLVAPVFIEVIALVALVGAAAAVTAGRPHWHYRLVAWIGALTAATINIVHGLAEYDAATAFGTALASIAGPGMWDLHEHGRIRKRDGMPSRRERRAEKKSAKAEAKRKAAEEKRQAAEKAAAGEAAEAERERLAGERQREFEDVWKEAVRIAAAVGSTPDDDAVWAQAYRNKKGCEPGESIESITARRAAEKRVEAALTGTPVNTLSKTTNAQRAIQVKAPRKTSSYKPVPPRRRRNDTPKFHAAARALAADAKRESNARQKDPS